MPIAAVAGIFAKETGYGFSFSVTQDPVASLASATAPLEAAAGEPAESDKPKARQSHLSVVK